MKIAIEFNEQTNTFTVQFNRGLAMTATTLDSYPPPPPFDYQIQAMADWLVKTYPSVLTKFGDKEVSGLQLNFEAPIK